MYSESYYYISSKNNNNRRRRNDLWWWWWWYYSFVLKNLIFLTSAYIASIQHVYDIININPGVAIDLKPGFDVLLLPSLVDIYNNDVNDV